MQCLISFERCQSSCEEHETSKHYKKKILSTVGFEPPTPHGLQIKIKSTVITTRLQLAWYKMELNVHEINFYTIYK